MASRRTAAFVTSRAAAVLVLLLLLTLPGAARAGGLHSATVLIIRHAEKPESGEGLAPAGEARAKAYVQYFQDFKFRDKPVKIDAIFAAADSKGSHRPRLTVEPTAAALGLPIEGRYKDKDYAALAAELETHKEGKDILICWHHGEIVNLLKALGADGDQLVPGGRWPGDEYDWVIALHYNHEGKVDDAQRIEEGLTAPH